MKSNRNLATGNLRTSRLLFLWFLSAANGINAIEFPAIVSLQLPDDPKAGIALDQTRRRSHPLCELRQRRRSAGADSRLDDGPG